MRGAAVLALALAGCAAAPPPREGGIVSTNPCADALLVRLAPAERIAAISHYSHEAAASSLPPDAARRFPATAGTAEEVIALRPSLVLASSFTPPATREAYARAGLRVLLLDSPRSVAASEAQVRAVAAALGERGRGAALVSEIEASLAGDAGQPGRPKRDALLFLSGDLATGPGTLLGELLTRAGFRDAAADYGLIGTGRVAIEAVAARPPDLILAPGESRAGGLRARVLARLGARTRLASFPRALINCGGPTIPAAMARLAALRRALP